MTAPKSIAARIRALAADYEPDCGEPGCEDCAAARELLALATEVERIAGERLRSDLDEYEDWSDRACEVADLLAKERE